MNRDSNDGQEQDYPTASFSSELEQLPKKFSVIEIPEHIKKNLDAESLWLFERVMALTASVEHAERVSEVMHRNILAQERRQYQRNLEQTRMLQAQQRLESSYSKLQIQFDTLAQQHAEILQKQGTQALEWAKFSGKWGILAIIGTALLSAALTAGVQWTWRKLTGQL